MQNYLVNYFHEAGQGRVFMSSSSVVTEDTIINWENTLKNKYRRTKVGIASFTKISGNIAPYEEI